MWLPLLPLKRGILNDDSPIRFGGSPIVNWGLTTQRVSSSTSACGRARRKIRRARATSPHRSAMLIDNHAPMSAPYSSRRSGRHLEDFVVGDANRLAYAAATRIADDDASTLISPLFIHGMCGVGKTHLLQGIANRHRARHPGANIRYTTAEAFTNSYIQSIRANNLDTFRKRFRRVDLLCIDDGSLLRPQKNRRNRSCCTPLTRLIWKARGSCSPRTAIHLRLTSSTTRFGRGFLQG